MSDGRKGSRAGVRGGWRPALLAGAALLALAPGCGGDGRVGEAREGPGTTMDSARRDAAIALNQANIAAVGMNLVAADVGLRSTRADGAEYCRSAAPAELGPHRATLEAAADPEVRRRAERALAGLGEAIDRCAGGAGADAVAEAIAAYNAAFARLRERIDALLESGT